MGQDLLYAAKVTSRVCKTGMGYFYVALSFKDTCSAGDVLGIFQSNHG